MGYSSQCADEIRKMGERMKLFKPEDFALISVYSRTASSIEENASNIANTIIKKYIESCPTVYKTEKKYKGQWSEEKLDIDTYKAKLCFIEEINKKSCDHIPHIHYYGGTHIVSNCVCKLCGVELEPDWKEKK